jgi:hypothetical protein
MLTRILSVLAVLFVFPFFPSVSAMNLQVAPGAPSCSDCDPTNACSGDCGDPGVACPFQEALNIAQCNDEDDTITLAAGSYDPTAITTADTECGDDGFCYDGASNIEDSSLTITGAGKGLTFIDGGGGNVTGLQVDPFAETDDGLTLSITNITFQNNGPTSGSNSGGLLVFMSNATMLLEDNEFINNGGEQLGGGGGGASLNGGSGSFTVNRNAFFDNQALSAVAGGGAHASVTDGNIVFTNNIFAGNFAEDNSGGGLDIAADDGATVSIVNNTFFDNEAAFGGGIFLGLCDTNTSNIFNNIVYLNVALVGADIAAGPFTKCTPDGEVNLFNNDFIVTEFAGAPLVVNQDATNVNVDPLWVNAAGDDFHLTAASPVIDQGDLTPPGGLPTPDFDGVTRPQGPLPDMGALEFQIIPTPSPTPTPTPPASGLLLFGSGCSLGSGAEAFSFLRFLLLAPLFWGVQRLSRHR